MTKHEDEFCWNVDSDSSNECEPWEEYTMLKEMLDNERLTTSSAATPRWRQEQFYQSQFPLVLIEKLFTSETDRATSEVFESRNFVFIVPRKVTAEPIMAQYQSFRNPVEMQYAFIQQPPLRIEVGSRGYEPACILPTIMEKMAKRGDIPPHYMHTKELVFDVDITDWDEVRDCDCVTRYEKTDICTRCNQAKDLESDLVATLGYCECEAPLVEVKLCSRCWCYLRASMLVMNYILTQQYGFRHLLFVFSGSKGYHCWVFDKEVKTFTEEQRTSIAEHFNPWREDISRKPNRKNKVRRIALKDENPIQDSVLFDKNNAFLDALFIETVVNNGVFTLGSAKVNKLLRKLLEMDLHSDTAKSAIVDLVDMAVVNKWTSVECWEELKKFIHTYLPSYRAQAYNRRILYMFIFPRIDAPVTTQIRHLIKLPYSLHPTTKLISTPILAYDLLTFDPAHCPSVSDLSEISKSMKETEEEIDIMLNPLNTIYYCRHCHPTLDVTRLCELFSELPPLQFAQKFLRSCFQRMTKFRMFRTLEHLQRHVGLRHGDDLVLYQDVRDTLSEWLRHLSTFENYCNTRQFEVLSLCFLFLLLEKQFITSVSENLMQKMTGLNLIPSDRPADQ